MRGTTAMERPKLKATRSIDPIASLWGKRAAMSVYPGKNSRKGRPIIIRGILLGTRAVESASSAVRINIARRSYFPFTFKILLPRYRSIPQI